MTGLIYKDAICLRKNLKMFIGVGFGVVALAVMFALSCKMGNISEGLKTYNAEDSMDKEMLIGVINMTMHVVLFIPMAFMGNIIDCFKEDRKAGFSNSLFSMPLNYKEIVGARYVSMMIYFVMGFIFSLITAIGVSMSSDRVKFDEMLSTTLFFAGIMTVYMGIVIPCVYAFGSDKSDLICAAPFGAVLIGAIAYVSVNEDKIPEDETGLLKILNDFMDLLTKKGYVVIAAAMVVLIASYFSSVLIIKKKKGCGI